jgi:FkbM family methyltransferase
MLKKMLKIIIIKVAGRKGLQKLVLFKNMMISTGNLVINSTLKLVPVGIRLRIKNLEIVKKLDYPSHKIFLNISSKFESQVRANSCQKEPGTIEWIQQLLKKGDVLFDVGANVGAYSLVASKFQQGSGKVYSFEPSFLNFPQLCRNIALNNCSKSVIPLQVALSNETRLDDFFYNNLTPGGATHNLGSPVDQMGESFQSVFQQSVMSFSLDDLIRIFKIPEPNHIKIDVDGIEYAVLQGAEKILNGSSINSIILELNEVKGEENEIERLLKDNNFYVHTKNELFRVNPSTRICNYVFIKRR